MRTLSLALVALAAFAGPSFGQKAAAPPVKEIMIGGQPPSPEPSGENTENCVEVEIGGDKVFNCLNDKLKRQSERVIPLPNIAPIDSHSSDIKLGIANMPAVKQQYGRNFGNSVIPYRPSPPVYAPPLGPR
jgi:hypothetical protein